MIELPESNRFKVESRYKLYLVLDSSRSTSRRIRLGRVVLDSADFLNPDREGYHQLVKTAHYQLVKTVHYQLVKNRTLPACEEPHTTSLWLTHTPNWNWRHHQHFGLLKEINKFWRRFSGNLLILFFLVFDFLFFCIVWIWDFTLLGCGYLEVTKIIESDWDKLLFLIMNSYCKLDHDVFLFSCDFMWKFVYDVFYL